MNILLFGFKKSGKTYIGLHLAKKLHMKFIDTDLLVEELYTARFHKSHSCVEIVKHHGMKLFRELEKQVIFSLENLENTVVALGGGSVLDEENLIHLQKIGSLVYLKTDKQVLKRRMLSGDFPAYIDPNDPTGSFEQMYSERLPIYESIPSLSVDTHNKTEHQVISLICEHVEKSRGHGGK